MKGIAVAGASGDTTDEGIIIEPGARSEDLETTSTDLSELHALLARARERLSFYEGFDRIIAENVRRSGELMLESLRVRDKLNTDANFLGAEERSRILRRLNRLDGALNTMQANLDDVVGQVSDLRESLTHAAPSDELPEIESTPDAGTGANDIDPATLMSILENERGSAGDEPGVSVQEDTPVEPAAVPQAPSDQPFRVDPPASQPAAAPSRQAAPVTGTTASVTPPTTVPSTPAPPAPISEPVPGAPAFRPVASAQETWNEQRTIEVIAHEVTRAAVALALQGHLRSLPQVAMVDAREFASGMLRLQVGANASLTEADLSGWSGSEQMEIVQLQPTVVELRFNP